MSSRRLDLQQYASNNVKAIQQNASDQSALWQKETVRSQARHLKINRQQGKRTIDILVSILLMAVLLPVFLLIAVAVACSSPGHVLYSQRRSGLNFTTFRIHKFRTMYEEDCDGDDQPCCRQATANDPRVTPLGRWLRSTSLDELPQLFNVLTGEMSLVGPRPH